MLCGEKMHIKSETLEGWMKFIRFHPDKAERYMDCFWGSQLSSKRNLLGVLEGEDFPGTTYIFGGWYGILAQLIDDDPNIISRDIYSIDNDPDCAWVINDVIKRDNIMPITADMATFEYEAPPNTVINCITEHVTQQQYDMWWENIPTGTFYILQGNNFWEADDHIRCSKNMDDFQHINNCCNSMLGFATWDCKGPIDYFERYMVWGIK